MASRDLYNVISAVKSLVPAARTATASGSSADLKGYHSAYAIIEAGAWTDGTHTFSLQESDDDSTFTDVADADLQGTEPVVSSGAGASQIYELGYLGSKRYLRVRQAVTGSPATGMVSAASIVRGHPATAPTR